MGADFNTTNCKLKPLRVTSRYFVLRSGYKVQILSENTQVYFKPSFLLEGWYDLFYDGRYSGTIPLSELKENFKVDNLLLNE